MNQVLRIERDRENDLDRQREWQRQRGKEERFIGRRVVVYRIGTQGSKKLKPKF